MEGKWKVLATLRLGTALRIGSRPDVVYRESLAVPPPEVAQKAPLSRPAAREVSPSGSTPGLHVFVTDALLCCSAPGIHISNPRTPFVPAGEGPSPCSLPMAPLAGLASNPALGVPTRL